MTQILVNSSQPKEKVILAQTDKNSVVVDSPQAKEKVVLATTQSNVLVDDQEPKEKVITKEGTTGADGPQGPQGVVGPAGATGPAGAQGPPGSNAAFDEYDAACLEMELSFSISNPNTLKETSYDNEGNLTNLSIYTSTEKTTKIFNKDFLYDPEGQLITILLTRISDNSTLTKEVSYNIDGSLLSIESIYTVLPSFVQNGISEFDLSIAETYKNGFNTLDDFVGMFIEPQDHLGTASHDITAEKSIEGGLSHKGWIYAPNTVVPGVNTNHRAYPTFQMNNTSFGIATGAVLIDFYAWVNIGLVNTPNRDWFSLATFTSYSDNQWPHSYLINVNFAGQIHLQHVPVNGASVHDIYEDTNVIFPSSQWVRVTTYIDYTSTNEYSSPFISVWQDGTLVVSGRFDHRISPQAYLDGELGELGALPPCVNIWDGNNIQAVEDNCGFVYEAGLAQMHFGLYTPPLVSSGVIYNDALTIHKLNKN